MPRGEAFRHFSRPRRRSERAYANNHMDGMRSSGVAGGGVRRRVGQHAHIGHAHHRIDCCDLDQSTQVGETGQAVGMAALSNGQAQPVTAGWRSDAPAVATATDAGLVTGVSNGRATIFVVSGGRQGQQVVRIVPDYQGQWNGLLRVTSCTQSGAWASIGFCDDFFVGSTDTFALNLTQSGESVTARANYGTGFVFSPVTAPIDGEGGGGLLDDGCGHEFRHCHRQRLAYRLGEPWCVEWNRHRGLEARRGVRRGQAGTGHFWCEPVGHDVDRHQRFNQGAGTVGENAAETLKLATSCPPAIGGQLVIPWPSAFWRPDPDHRRAQMRLGCVPELLDQRMGAEHTLDDGALHALAATVNQPHLAQPGLVGRVGVL